MHTNHHSTTFATHQHPLRRPNRMCSTRTCTPTTTTFATHQHPLRRQNRAKTRTGAAQTHLQSAHQPPPHWQHINPAHQHTLHNRATMRTGAAQTQAWQHAAKPRSRTSVRGPSRGRRPRLARGSAPRAGAARSGAARRGCAARARRAAVCGVRERMKKRGNRNKINNKMINIKILWIDQVGRTCSPR